MLRTLYILCCSDCRMNEYLAQRTAELIAELTEKFPDDQWQVKSLRNPGANAEEFRETFAEIAAANRRGDTKDMVYVMSHDDCAFMGFIHARAHGQNSAHVYTMPAHVRTFDAIRPLDREEIERLNVGLEKNVLERDLGVQVYGAELVQTKVKGTPHTHVDEHIVAVLKTVTADTSAAVIARAGLNPRSTYILRGPILGELKPGAIFFAEVGEKKKFVVLAANERDRPRAEVYRAIVEGWFREANLQVSVGIAVGKNHNGVPSKSRG